MTQFALHLVGLPGMGKSYWLNEFLKKSARTWKVCSSDNHIERLAAQEDPPLTYNQGFFKYGKDAERAYSRDLKAVGSDDAVIDRTNLTLKVRRRHLAELFKHTHIAVLFGFNETVTESVWRDRLASRPGKTLPPNILRNMQNFYVPPTLGEGFAHIVDYRELLDDSFFARLG